MLEKIYRFISGTPEEQQANRLIERFGRKKSLTSKEEGQLASARRLSRRLFLKQLAAGGVGLAATSTSGVGLYELYNKWQESERQKTEQVYHFYLDSFRKLGQGDKQAEDILRFVQQRRKKAAISGTQVLADENSTTVDNIFFTAVVDEKQHPEMFNSMPGFAEYRHKQNPTVLLLKANPIDPTFAGAIFGHESLHVYQWLNGIEQSRGEAGFIQGEVDAYDFEFRLLDQYTNGQFRQVLHEQSVHVAPNSIRGRLSTMDYERLKALFPTAQTIQEERGLRVPIYTIAMNFALIEERYPQETQNTEKANYLKAMFRGEYPIIQP